MAKVTPEEYAEKHARRLKASTEDIRKGIDRVTEAPGKAAVRAKDRMRTNLNAAIDDGTWEAQTAKVTVDNWKEAAKDKGIGRIAQGIDSAQPKQVAMAGKLLAAVDASVAEADRTPRGTLEDNIGRMTTFVRGMAKRKLRRPGA